MSLDETFESMELDRLTLSLIAIACPSVIRVRRQAYEAVYGDLVFYALPNRYELFCGE